MICINCQKNPAQRIQLCIPCWALVVHGEPDRLPPFPPIGLMFERHGGPADLRFLRERNYPACLG